MVRKFFAVVLLGLLVPSGAWSQSVSTTASSDKSDYQVGDYIHFVLRVKSDTSVTIYTPSFTDSLRNVSLLKTFSPTEEDSAGKKTITFNYILSGYDSAGVVVPPVSLMYKAPGDSVIRVAYSNPVSFTIRTLKVNTQQDIKDVKPPLAIPLDWKLVLLWVVVILAGAAIVYFLYRLYKKKRAAANQAAPALVLPPHVVAMNALKELAEQELWRRGQIKEYHSRITEIVRRYFEDRFGMPAMELPTSESVELLRTKDGTEPVLEITYEFLSNADMVKFAKFTPLDSVNEQMMRQAMDIVNRTAPRDNEDGTPESKDVR